MRRPTELKASFIPNVDMKAGKELKGVREVNAVGKLMLAVPKDCIAIDAFDAET
jgi:hypothetical protein